MEAIHTEDQETLVIYKDSNGNTWARPKEMFEDYLEYNGKPVKRFTLIEQLFSHFNGGVLMARKYHVNKKGKPSVCRAKDGNCPFGGNESHYNTIEDAQKAADKINEQNHGLFNELKNENEFVKRSNTSENQIELAIRIQKLEDKESKISDVTYFSRCESSERLDDYIPKKTMTTHYSRDRKKKNQIMKTLFGDGKLIGHYKVNHELNENEGMKEQIIGIYDTGQIRIYDINHGELVTTFIPHKNRMEVMLVKAGEIPDEEWLNNVQQNKEKIDAEWDKHVNEEREKLKRKRAAAKESSHKQSNTPIDSGNHSKNLNNSSRERDTSKKEMPKRGSNSNTKKNDVSTKRNPTSNTRTEKPHNKEDYPNKKKTSKLGGDVVERFLRSERRRKRYGRRK